MLNRLVDLSSCFSSLDLEGRSRVVVAVSGGSDSLALLFLLHDYVKGRSNPDIIAVTVDHRLRPESAEEARWVAGLCAEYGIKHRTLTWDDTKPVTGISQAAREARQHLLSIAAREAGTDLVMLAHTANDQAETIRMRMSRGAGRGLAGIAPATLYDHLVWFVRPLLQAERMDLRQYLASRSIEWIDDPSNTDLRYERARVRQSLGPIDAEDLLTTAASAGEERERLGGQIASVVRDQLRQCAPGLLRLPLAAMREMPQASAVYLTRILLAVAGGAPHLPDQERTAGLLANILEGIPRATLSRCVVSRHRDHLYLHRENRDLSTQPVSDGLLWDNRYRLHSTPLSEKLCVAPMGVERAQRYEPMVDGCPCGIAKAAMAAQPVILRNDEIVEPSVDGVTIKPVLGPWVRLIPSFDYDLASALCEILQCGNLPDRPWRRHKQG